MIGWELRSRDVYLGHVKYSGANETTRESRLVWKFEFQDFQQFCDHSRNHVIIWKYEK